MGDIVKTLHPLERKVLPLLKDNINSVELTIKSKLKDVEVMRALQWLENKKVLKIKLEMKEIIHLGELGKKYKD